MRGFGAALSCTGFDIEVRDRRLLSRRRLSLTSGIRDIEGPHDLEALEHGEDFGRLARTLDGKLAGRNSGDGHRATGLACGRLRPHPRRTPHQLGTAA